MGLPFSSRIWLPSASVSYSCVMASLALASKADLRIGKFQRLFWKSSSSVERMKAQAPALSLQVVVMQRVASELKALPVEPSSRGKPTKRASLLRAAKV